MKRSLLKISMPIFCLMLLGISACQRPVGVGENLQSRIHHIMDFYLTFGGQQAISIGLITPDNSFILHDGNGVIPMDSSLYEIGGLTEVFTGVLFADYVISGQIRPNDSIEGIWPTGVPALGEDKISYEHLATHTSGFPEYDEEEFLKLSPADQSVFFKDFLEEDFYNLTSITSLETPPGSRYAPNPANMAILAHLLELKFGKEYDQLLNEKITTPLGLGDTEDILRLNNERFDRVIPPVSADGESLPLFQFGEYQGASSLLSTPDNLMEWMRAYLDPFSTLNDAMGLTLEKHFDLGQNRGIGYGWKIIEEAGHPRYFQSGHTHHSAIMHLIPSKGIGLFVLTNSPSEADTEKLSEQVLDLLLN